MTKRDLFMIISTLGVYKPKKKPSVSSFKSYIRDLNQHIVLGTYGSSTCLIERHRRSQGTWVESDIYWLYTGDRDLYTLLVNDTFETVGGVQQYLDKRGEEETIYIMVLETLFKL